MGLRFGKLRLRVKFCNMEGAFLSMTKNVPGVDELIIFDIELNVLPETCGVTLTCSARILPSRVTVTAYSNSHNHHAARTATAAAMRVEKYFYCFNDIFTTRSSKRR